MTRPKKPKPRRTRPDAGVGARMAQAREAAGKTQADMAYDLRQAGFGTAESSISAWENGHQDLYAMHLRELGGRFEARSSGPAATLSTEQQDIERDPRRPSARLAF